METRNLRLLIVALGLAALAARAPAQEGSAKGLTPQQQLACHSNWGPNDEIGAANYLTPQLARDATKLVRTGKVYSLGVEINKDVPAYGGRTLNLLILETNQLGLEHGFGANQITFLDDVYMGYVGVGSQIDGLGHLGIDNVYYNCNRATDFARSDGLTKLGIENVPNIVTRGVLLDMTQYFGIAVLDAGTAFNRKDIQEQARRQGISIRQGDVVLFHTGWLSLIGVDNKRYISGQPGLGADGARYLAELGVVAVGADNYGLGAVPMPNGNLGDEHQILLAENGVYILENMNTAELARDKAYEFMFVLGAAKVTGGVQSFVNPTAIR